MIIYDGRSRRKLTLEATEETRVPWRREVVVAFQGYHPELLDAGRDDVQCSGYYLGIYKGFVSGVIKSLQPPMQLFHSPQALLSALFPDFKDVYDHHHLTITHPLVYQVPDGVIGGGLLLVRNASELGFGRGALPSSHVERQALARSRALMTLKELDYTQPDQRRVETPAPAKSIYASLLTVFPEAMVKGMLSEKLKSFGAKSSLDLSPVQLLAMIKWADEMVRKQNQINAELGEDPSAGKKIPAFNPVRGATRGRSGVVTDAVPENFDEQVEKLFSRFVALGDEDLAGDLIAQYGYDCDTSSAKVKRMTRDALRDALATRAAD